jgi:hypothetical protein
VINVLTTSGLNALILRSYVALFEFYDRAVPNPHLNANTSYEVAGQWHKMKSVFTDEVFQQKAYQLRCSACLGESAHDSTPDNPTKTHDNHRVGMFEPRPA